MNVKSIKEIKVCSELTFVILTGKVYIEEKDAMEMGIRKDLTGLCRHLMSFDSGLIRSVLLVLEGQGGHGCAGELDEIKREYDALPADRSGWGKRLNISFGIP